MQQTFANVKTASGMGIEGQPAVDTNQRGEGVRLIDSQPQADQRPQRVADHAVTGDPGPG